MNQAKETYEASGESAALDSLYDQLDACTLKAQTKGKITSLNATIGGSINGTVATIQDPNSLKISITIGEADINKVSLGMTCKITSDATTKTISGTLTQLDPVSSQSGNFGAEVTVSDIDTGLLIGMNASVEIIVSATDECFNVPLDAIGNDDDGNGDYVYRKTGGSGVDMTFEKVYVVTGEQNDYYIEISSDDLAVGDVIRSSSDLTQGIETTQTANGDQSGGAFSDLLSGIFGSGGGNSFPDGDFSGGNFPSGDFSGGNFPSGNMPSGGGSGRPSGGNFSGGFPGGGF